MRSRVFSRFDPKNERNKQFAQDLQCALRLTEDQQAKCASALVAYLSARFPSQEERILSDLEQATRLPRVRFEPAMSVMSFFLKKLDTPETRDDKPEDWAADLQSEELGLVTTDADRAAFESMAKKVVAAVDGYRAEAARRSYARGVLPALRACGHTVEVRAVQEDNYRWGDKIGKYVPKIIDIVPVVSVHLGTNAEGEDGQFYFQMREEQIDDMIDQLLAAKRDLEALKNLLPRQQDTSRASEAEESGA